MTKQKTRINRKKKRTQALQEQQYVIGNYAFMTKSNRKTVLLFPNTTLRQVRYYREKVERGVHWGAHGGLRFESQKVSDALLAHIIILISWVCDYNPGFTLQEYVDLIFWTYNIQLSISWVHNIFTNLLHFSYRKLNVIQKAKFTDENINYYYSFINWIQSIDCSKIVWIDESHFDSRKQKPRFGRGRKGKAINFINDTSIQENFSLSALMRINEPIYYEIRYDSNDQWDFCQFMIQAYAFENINSGDFIIFDNASVHSSTSMLLLDDFFSALNINLIRTPTYSPEVNGIEKIVWILEKHDLSWKS